MAIFHPNLFREPMVAVPVVQDAAPDEVPVIPGNTGGYPGWTRGTAVAISIAFHLLLLAGSMKAQTPAQFALTSSGQKASAAEIQVRLVARSLAPKPLKAEAKPPHKRLPAEPRRIDKPRRQVFAAQAPARHTAEINTPVLPAMVEPPMEKLLQAESAPPQAAVASVLPTMRLPGASADKEVKNVACNIPQPRYPFAIKRAGVEGTVWLYAAIGAAGDIQSAEVVQSSGSQELDASARSAILSGRCDPYIENGQRISVAARLPVNFRLGH